MGVKSLKSKMERYAAGNLESARILLADPERYQGLMLEWAARIIAVFHIENPSREAEAAPQPAEARLKAAEPREGLSLQDRSEIISDLTSNRR
jgi:hypothetical protein